MFIAYHSTKIALTFAISFMTSPRTNSVMSGVSNKGHILWGVLFIPEVMIIKREVSEHKVVGICNGPAIDQGYSTLLLAQGLVRGRTLVFLSSKNAISP